MANLSTSALRLTPQSVDASAKIAQPAANPRSLAALWARKYVLAFANDEAADPAKVDKTLMEVASKEGRITTAKKLQRNLTSASAQAWSQTEALLSEQVQRYGVDLALINPWEIAAEAHTLFQKCLNAYADCITPRHLSVIVGSDFGTLRQKYTAIDPRTLGFVSMQFHYTGLMLLKQLSPSEQALFSPYLKVMDDHLYMPLRAAYEAAATHTSDSVALAAVQQLLPVSSAIASAVYDQVHRLHPRYESHSGALGSATVKVSSIRDVEMFQVYLCLCVLENSIRSVQQELFPLCVMLYPCLKVKWELVQEMLQTLGWEMHERLSPEHLAVFFPYLKALTEMFSTEVFSEA